MTPRAGRTDLTDIKIRVSGPHNGVKVLISDLIMYALAEAGFSVGLNGEIVPPVKGWPSPLTVAKRTVRQLGWHMRVEISTGKMGKTGKKKGPAK